ncbi:MAG: hypothetical protein ACLVE3_09590 [[Clostridium] scindens]
MKDGTNTLQTGTGESKDGAGRWRRAASAADSTAKQLVPRTDAGSGRIRYAKPA